MNSLYPRREGRIVVVIVAVLGTAFMGLAHGGCTTEEPKLSDFVEDFAHSTCTRQIRCGWTELEQQECERQVQDYLCSHLDCTNEYVPADSEMECLVQYEDLACEITQSVCTFGE